jgi:hypothetical protein
LATIAGDRYGTPNTRVATLILEVAAATQVSIVHTSYDGSLPQGWSEAETKSNPSSSAARASPAGAAPGAAEVEMFNPNTIAP